MAARRFERLARVIAPEKLNRGACGLTLPPAYFLYCTNDYKTRRSNYFVTLNLKNITSPSWTT